MKLTRQEIELKGEWTFDGNQIIPDEICKRIDWLKSAYLRKMATDSTGWDTLYVDPEDGRYWELIYPESGMHGGGPPHLINVSTEVARTKYGL